MRIDYYVTPWGFPGLRWFDTLAIPYGSRGNTDRRIERRLWINSDGNQMLAAEGGRDIYVGSWRALYDVRISPKANRMEGGSNRLTISLVFQDGVINNIADSVGGDEEMRCLLDMIVKVFRHDPDAWRYPTQGTGLKDDLFVAPQRQLMYVLRTRSKFEVGNKLLTEKKWTGGKAAQAIDWLEPVKTQSGLLCLIHRILYVRDDLMWIHSGYMGHCYFSVCAKSLFLEGFGVAPADNEALPPKHYLPFYYAATSRIDAKFIIFAKFKYHYRIPLTIAHGTKSETEDFASLLTETFLYLD